MVRRTTSDRWTVITWHNEGLTTADICHKTGFDRRFVGRWVKKFENDEVIEDGPRMGRPKEAHSGYRWLSKGKCAGNDTARVE